MAIGRLPTTRHREEGAIAFPVDAARSQRPDEGLELRVLQRLEIIAARMIELSIDRKNARTDDLSAVRIDRPGRRDLRRVFDLLGEALVQRLFLFASLRIGQSAEHIIDAR